MTPPEADATTPQGHVAERPPAVSVCLDVLKNRSDFLRAARARRQATTGFILQARKRDTDEPSKTPIRVGYTCSKKVGNAVARNRAKRRLREIARAVIPSHGKDGWDYVLIGRAEVTANRPYFLLQTDLRDALIKLHGARK